MREKKDSRLPLDEAEKEARVLQYAAERIAEENFHPPIITSEIYDVAEYGLKRLNRRWPGDFRSFMEAEDILLDVKKVKPLRENWLPAHDRVIGYIAQLILKETLSIVKNDLSEEKLPTPEVVMKKIRSRLKESRVHYEMEYLYPGSAELFDTYASIVIQVVLDKFKKKIQKK